MSFAGSSEYSLAHVKKALIPRACLDRSAPAGWTLNVDPEGVWVFTNDHTQEQVKYSHVFIKKIKYPCIFFFSLFSVIILDCHKIVDQVAG